MIYKNTHNLEHYHLGSIREIFETEGGRGGAGADTSIQTEVQ